MFKFMELVSLIRVDYRTSLFVEFKDSILDQLIEMEE